MQPDPFVPKAGDPQMLNRYAYVLNNPLARNDPTGYRYEESAGYVADPYYWYDLQYWTVQQLNANAVLWEFGFINDLLYAGSMASAYYIPYVPQATTATAMNEFYQLVCDRSPTDYKQAMKMRFGESIRLGNKWFEFSTLGNTAYGFDAADSGIAPWLAHVGAGFAQLQDYFLRDGDPPGPWYLAFDSVDDYYAVELGYEIYEKGYAPDNKLTVLELNSLLTDYQHLNKLQFKTGPEGQRPVDTAWPYSSGDFDGKREPWPAFLFPSFQ